MARNGLNIHAVLLLVFFYSVTTFAQQSFKPADLVHHIQNKIPVTKPLPVTTLDQAYAYQDRVVELLKISDGDRAGYKAALTSEATQKKFNYDRPVLGTVLKNMLLRNRVSLDQDFATRPLIEADLMVLVGDESINDAETITEVLHALEGVHPLIELPDLIFEQGVNILPHWITAMNAGAKKAVVGDPVLTLGDTNLLNRLPNVQATVLNKRGEVLATGKADSLMGHPFNVVLWIRDEVHARGGRLEAGDVLWLGSITPPIPVEPGESYQVLFTGLNVYPVSIQVNIRKNRVTPQAQTLSEQTSRTLHDAP